MVCRDALLRVRTDKSLIYLCEIPLMELQKYTDEEIPDLVKYQILSFMRTEWPEGFVGRWRGRRWINLREFNPLHFVLMDQDFVVAHAVRLWRDFGSTMKHFIVCMVFREYSFFLIISMKAMVNS